MLIRADIDTHLERARKEKNRKDKLNRKKRREEQSRS
jgi:hypothetical protein